MLQFIANLRQIKNRCSHDVRFLDVGCGLGSKVGIAQSLGFDAYGLEINPQYATIASEQVGPNRILCTDAVGFREYGNFDVIYFYNPMVSDEIEPAIMANAKMSSMQALQACMSKVTLPQATDFTRIHRLLHRPVMEDGGMSALPVSEIFPARLHTVQRGREILRAESNAIATIAQSLDDSFSEAIEVLLSCRGSVIVTGMGKAGLVGQKIAASFSSTGTPSHFMHPAEAVHGDLGSVRRDDVILLLSYSGETDEVTRLLPSLRVLASYMIAITAKPTSTLAKNVDLTLALGGMDEACPLGLAPSSTTTAMLALGDALTLVTSELRGFTRDHFARFHPAGALGRSLTPVEQIMRPLTECRVAHQAQALRAVLVKLSRPGRRTGAVMLHDDDGKLTGVFTDSDLAKLLERAGENLLDQPISSCMTKKFQVVSQGEMLPVALRILAERKISELPVIDHERRPQGLIDITDVMSMMKGYWPTAQDASDGDSARADSDGDAHILPLRRPKFT